jgi:hypothetical protein
MKVRAARTRIRMGYWRLPKAHALRLTRFARNPVPPNEAPYYAGFSAKELSGRGRASGDNCRGNDHQGAERRGRRADNSPPGKI